MFLDCVATFTCVELCSYKTFMFYTLLTSLIALDRNELRKKVGLFYATVVTLCTLRDSFGTIESLTKRALSLLCEGGE